MVFPADKGQKITLGLNSAEGDDSSAKTNVCVRNRSDITIGISK